MGRGRTKPGGNKPRGAPANSGVDCGLWGWDGSASLLAKPAGQLGETVRHGYCCYCQCILALCAPQPRCSCLIPVKVSSTSWGVSALQIFVLGFKNASVVFSLSRLLQLSQWQLQPYESKWNSREISFIPLRASSESTSLCLNLSSYSSKGK